MTTRPTLVMIVAGLLMACSAGTDAEPTAADPKPADPVEDPVGDPKPDEPVVDEQPVEEDPTPETEVDDPETDDPAPDTAAEHTDADDTTAEVPQSPDGEGYGVDQIAADWTLKDGDGNDVNLHDYYGKVIFFEAGSEW